MKKILILFAHPALQKSRVNKILIDGLEKIESVTFRDLYQFYPEIDIDVPEEQELLVRHDVIVFHHPFFWYSTPPILKEWQDLVLEHDWAYGSKGNALKGKLFFNLITTGGRAEAYTAQGYNNFTIRQLLAPIEQTVKLCKMIFLPPYIVHGTHSITREKIEQHKENYFELLALLKDGKLDFAKIKKLEYLNDYRARELAE